MPVLDRTIFQIVDEIAAGPTVAEIWSTLLRASSVVNLPYGVACYVPLMAGQPIEIVAESLPLGWIRDYLLDGLDKGDLVAERARRSAASFEWKMSDWDGVELSPIQKRWRSHNLKYGIQGGLCVFDFRRGDNMLLVLCGPDGTLDRHDRLALSFVGHEVMLRLREVGVTNSASHFMLSRRETECLQWAAKGKTDWEIGQILSLSEKTVNVYIERAKSKYGVRSRTQAITLAMHARLLVA
jgi:DNA-binding CsgD family transcriptional regulator